MLCYITSYIVLYYVILLRYITCYVMFLYNSYVYVMFYNMSCYVTSYVMLYNILFLCYITCYGLSCLCCICHITRNVMLRFCYVT